MTRRPAPPTTHRLINGDASVFVTTEPRVCKGLASPSVGVRSRICVTTDTMAGSGVTNGVPIYVVMEYIQGSVVKSLPVSRYPLTLKSGYN